MMISDDIAPADALAPGSAGGPVNSASIITSTSYMLSVCAPDSRFRLHMRGIHVQDFPVVPVEVEEAA
jgi:hypothetical protein